MLFAITPQAAVNKLFYVTATAAACTPRNPFSCAMMLIVDGTPYSSFITYDARAPTGDFDILSTLHFASLVSPYYYAAR